MKKIFVFFSMAMSCCIAAGAQDTAAGIKRAHPTYDSASAPNMSGTTRHHKWNNDKMLKDKRRTTVDPMQKTDSMKRTD